MRASLVGPHEPRVANNVGAQYRCELPLLTLGCHVYPFPRTSLVLNLENAHESPWKQRRDVHFLSLADVSLFRLKVRI